MAKAKGSLVDVKWCRGGTVENDASSVATGRARIARILAKHVEYVSKVEADCTHT
jgi:hypothetical protein